MKLYWSIDKIPELAGLSPQQKKQALQFCIKKHAFKLWQTWLCLFVSIFLSLAVRSAFQFTGSIADGITGGFTGLIAWFTLLNALRPHFQNYVRKNFTNE
jgi:hypothetical protein